MHSFLTECVALANLRLRFWFCFSFSTLGGSYSFRCLDDISFGPFVCGPYFLIVWAWTFLCFDTLNLCLTLILAMTFVLSHATL